MIKIHKFNRFFNLYIDPLAKIKIKTNLSPDNHNISSEFKYKYMCQFNNFKTRRII